jgi:hypothetical protein
MAEDHPEGRLLGEPKATKAMLKFLANTEVALAIWLYAAG